MPNELYRDFIEDQFDRVVNAINNELPTPTSTDIGKFVGVVSDGGAGAEYALDAVPNELPTPTTADIGKFATVVSDGSGGAEYSLDNVVVPQELPTPTTADIGKFATVVSDGGTGAEYALGAVPNELPTPTSADIGKVVNVVSDGGTGAEYSIGSPVRLYDNTSPYLDIQVAGGSIININLHGKTRSEIFNLLGATYSVRPNRLIIDGYTSTWQYHYHCQAFIYCIDDFKDYLVFKAEAIMNDPNNTAYDITYKMHRTDATKDIFRETAI